MMHPNALARALDLTSVTRVDAVLGSAVEHGAALVGGVAQAGFGNPNIKGVPVDLALAAGLMLTGSPLARTVSRGLTLGAFGRMGHDFGSRLHSVRASIAK